MRSDKFGSCCHADSCFKSGGIPIPEVVGHLLPYISQCPARVVKPLPQGEHTDTIPSSSGSKEGSNRDTSASQGGEDHGIRS